MVSMHDKAPAEEQYGGSEMLYILIPPSDGLQFLNGAVESLSFSVVSFSLESVEDISGMTGKHAENLVYFWCVCTGGLDKPHGVEGEGLVGLCRADNVPEVLLDSPCPRHLIVGLADRIEHHLLLVHEAGFVFEEEILGVLQLVLYLHLSNPRLVFGFFQVLDEVMRVVEDLALGNVFLATLMNACHISIEIVLTAVRWMGAKFFSINCLAFSSAQPSATSITKSVSPSLSTVRNSRLLFVFSSIHR